MNVLRERNEVIYNEMIKASAITEEGGCTVYSFFIGLSLICPEISTENLLTFVSSLIHIPVEKTELLAIAQSHDLPAPFYLNDRKASIVTWILQGQGEPLFKFLNAQLNKNDIPVKCSYALREEIPTEEILERVKNGTVAVVPCYLHTSNENHHVALAFIDEKWVIFDINMYDADTSITEELLSLILSDPTVQVTLPNYVISVKQDPIIFIERTKPGDN